MGSVKVEGRTFGQTYELEDDIVGEPMIGSLQCDYPLCEADYLRLTTRGSRLKYASVTVLLVSAGFALSVVAKWAAAWWANTPANVEAWEYWAVGIGVAVAGVLAVIACIVPDEKRALLRNMKQHFESHPRQRKMMRRVNDE